MLLHCVLSQHSLSLCALHLTRAQSFTLGCPLDSILICMLNNVLGPTTPLFSSILANGAASPCFKQEHSVIKRPTLDITFQTISVPFQSVG